MKPGRRWLIALVVAVVVVAGGVAAVRWALDPLLLKGLTESRLSAALGQPVRIGAIHLSFFPSPSVYGTDITVGGGAARGSAPSLDLHAIRLHPRLASIFSRPVVIDRIAIDGMALNVLRDSSGRWLLPLPSAGAAAPATAPEKAQLDVAQVRLDEGQLTITDERPNGRGLGPKVVAIDGIDGTVRHTDQTTRLEGLTASVGRSTVAGDGSIGPDGVRLALRWANLRSADLPLIFALIGTNAPEGLSVEGRNPLTIDLRVDAAGRPSASGRVAADRAALGTLTLTSFVSPISFAGNRLVVAPMAFHAYSGTGGGRLAVNIASAPVSWALNATMQRLDIDQFVSANTSAKGKISGTGTIDARLTGTSRAPVERSVTGTAAVSVASGIIRNFPLVAAVYSALKLGTSADKDLHFQALSATFTIANARAATDDLLAKTGEMTMTAAGSIGFDQTLALTGKVAFSPSRSDAFVHSVKELSALKNDRGEIEVPFTVGGSVPAPRYSIDVADLLKRGLTNELKRGLGDRLRDLFRKKK